MTRVNTIRLTVFSLCLSAAALAGPAQANEGAYSSLVASHAAAHGLPPSLVHRVIMRESRYNPRAVSKGNYGMMQIRLGTARAMGYQRQRRRPARCRHQHDLCREVSRRCLSRRRRQSRPRRRALCERLWWPRRQRVVRSPCRLCL